MRKHIICPIVILSLLCNANYITIAKDIIYSTEINSDQSYSFVGKYRFYTNGFASITLDVYEQRQVIDGYLVSIYYAKYDGQYYKMMPCNYQFPGVSGTYNYYISIDDGVKIYTSL